MTEQALTFLRIFRNWKIMKWIIGSGNVKNKTTLETVAALLALADSTEAARDERYPASNWKVTQ